MDLLQIIVGAAGLMIAMWFYQMGWMAIVVAVVSAAIGIKGLIENHRSHTKKN